MYTLYEIGCMTPDHYYVGVTRNYGSRARGHSLGKGSKFTRAHGVKQIYIVNTFRSEEKAKTAEWWRVRYLKKLGLTACGAGYTWIGDPHGR